MSTVVAGFVNETCRKDALAGLLQMNRPGPLFSNVLLQFGSSGLCWVGRDILNCWEYCEMYFVQS